METIAQFEKVSFDQFKESYQKLYGDSLTEGYLMEKYESIKLPTRATKGSAGYDFYAPYSFDLHENVQITVPTGIRCRINPGWMLAIFPKSGLGFKHGTRLANTIGVVDQDFYFSDNEGHIMVKMSSEKYLTLSAGQKFVQGIFIPYGLAQEDEVTEVRNGGFGSTGK